MSNLVGNGLNQVPTNSMLGGLAYQDPEYASIKDLDLKNLSQINSEIANTAVDVFVYDTRKDSDGGAWRKRTQHTSWYNETLNTATRGSRREFPAVAVLVLEGTQVTIYDGDDPDLPMWMVFDRASSAGWTPNNTNILGVSYSTFTSISMLNGIFAMGADYDSDNNNGVLIKVSFIEDTGYFHGVKSVSSSYPAGGFGRYRGSIAERDSGNGHININDTDKIVNVHVNDVAMTVLPNAPIDSATGLPIPTIAVATDGGVSVIKDDGTVFDVIDGNSSRKCYDVSFTKDHKIMHTGDLGAGSTHAGNVFVTNILTTDRAEYDNNSDLYRWYSTSTNYPRINGGDTFATRVLDPVDVGGHHYAMADVGVSLIEDGTSSSVSNTDGMVAYITKDYNTGYMHGDIEGAFLSDTDDTDAVVAYSDGFSNNDKGWSFADNGSSGISGGNLTIEQNSSARATDSDALNGVATGTKLTFTLTVSGSGTGNLILDDDGAGAGVGGNTNYGLINATGSYTFTANKTASNRLRFLRSTGSNNYDINFLNISTEYDRSINDKGLGVFGTVPKSAVATGADLVAYGAFGTTNYLKQPYNSNLAPGTEAYSVTCWFKTGTSNSDQYIFDRASGSTGSRNLLLIMHSGASGSSANKLQWWHRDSSNNYTEIQVTDKTVTDDVWHQVVALYDGSTYKVYVDGIVSSNTSTVGRNVGNDGSPPLYIGVRHSETSPMTGKLALFRYSKSAPSPEQIKKIYEDEKHLFQENAKCTLYGSSDAVTALAYDDSTNLLYAGTSAGRSEFQGLRRINNTTTAVTTAISASNGLVAEQ